MDKINEIIGLYFRSLEEFNKFESSPKDFGTGDKLYSSEIHTLKAIGKNEHSNLTEISENLGISKSGVSKFVKKLLSKKLITKYMQPDNKKEVYFSLTDKGKIAYQGHEEFGKSTFKAIYEILDTLDDKQAEFICEFFKKLVTEVEKINKV